MLDLTPSQKALVCAIVDAHLERQRVRVFGSRAQRTAKPFSDLDLLVLGAPLDDKLRGMLEEAFDESDLPFRVDIVEAATLSPEFRVRIEPLAVALD
ncbi:MAG: nucleotidyltransferase domain-containing protein [Burkholderiales bacterium]|nr:nucleotidyltransferase domain-containing protein [Burkholderiales bacterium]